MRWEALHGVACRAQREHLKRVNKPIPLRFYPPTIMEGWADWVDAFYELSTDRQLTGYGSGPIPAASIERHTAGWGEFEKAAFHRCIRAMDSAYLEATAPAKEGEVKGGLPQPDKAAK